MWILYIKIHKYIHTYSYTALNTCIQKQNKPENKWGGHSSQEDLKTKEANQIRKKQLKK